MRGGNECHANGLQRETRHIGEFAAQAIHNHSCGIKHRHVNGARDAEDEADLFIPQAEHLRAVQGDDEIATTANGLGKQLSSARGDQVFAVGAKDAENVAQMPVLRRGNAFGRGFDRNRRHHSGHESDDAEHEERAFDRRDRRDIPPNARPCKRADAADPPKHR